MIKYIITRYQPDGSVLRGPFEEYDKGSAYHRMRDETFWMATAAYGVHEKLHDKPVWSDLGRILLNLMQSDIEREEIELLGYRLVIEVERKANNAAS